MRNKNDIIEAIASKADISKNAATRALDTAFEEIIASLCNGQKVVFPGFGSFDTKKRAARKGRNPQTGEEMQIPAATVASFKAGKKLKDAVNEAS